MIAISEPPFFVVDINDIEIAYFERVTFGIKNFDLAIVFKDFVTFKRINSVPIEHLDEIKAYLDEIGIIYFEGILPMNWVNTLSYIREDFQSFIDEGGWKFLTDDNDSKDGAGEEEEEEDPEFDVESEADLEDSESDFSDDDDYSDDSDDDDGDSDEEELSEDGMDWDEMEKRAEEEDRRAATRR